MNTNPGPLNRIPRLPRHQRHLLAPLFFELDANEGDPQATDGILERIEEIAGRHTVERLTAPHQGGPR